mgnify:CR=1 FL=1
MSSLEYSNTVADDLSTLLPLHIPSHKCTNRSAMSTSTSANNLSTTDAPSETATKTVEIVTHDPSTIDDTIIIQPSNLRGSVTNLVEAQTEETTFPTTFDHSSHRFQFFVSTFSIDRIIIVVACCILIMFIHRDLIRYTVSTIGF